MLTSMASLDCLLIGLGLASLACLVWFSLRLGAMRIFQVDECTEVNVAWQVATGHAKVIADTSIISLFQLFLVWIFHNATQAIDLFVYGRFAMLEIFWLNILLIALATGEKLFSRRGLIALLGAATLAPLWDYGFEIRHDNPLLTGILLIWCVLRVRPSGIQSYVLAGALAVILQFVAYKAFVYTVPISFAALVFPPPGHKAARWKLVSAWVLGVLVTFLVLRFAYMAAGYWDGYLLATGQTSKLVAGGMARFWPEIALTHLATQAPLLLGLTAAALIAFAGNLRTNWRTAHRWEGNLPECALFLVASGAFLLNPTPFPYNVLELVPYAYILAFRYGRAIWQQIATNTSLVPALSAFVLVAHLAPFTVATLRHLDWPNTRQDKLMHYAEKLTDPAKDPVYDGVGLVPTRQSIDPRAFIHSLSIRNLLTGPGPRVHEMMAANPAAVFIPNYRTDALSEKEHAFIRNHYVSLADDFWVLGAVLPAGGGTFEIIHPGRYRISTLQGSDLAGTYPGGWEGVLTPEDPGTLNGSLNGKILQTQVVELGIGTHQIQTDSASQTAVVWMGPKLDRVHRIGSVDHRYLFYNWY